MNLISVLWMSKLRFDQYILFKGEQRASENDKLSPLLCTDQTQVIRCILV